MIDPRDGALPATLGELSDCVSGTESDLQDPILRPELGQIDGPLVSLAIRRPDCHHDAREQPEESRGSHELIAETLRDAHCSPAFRTCEKSSQRILCSRPSRTSSSPSCMVF